MTNQATSPKQSTTASDPSVRQIISQVRRTISNQRKRLQEYLGRRPHRSFRVTRRRDYSRSLALPGYWSFTNQVFQTLWKHKKLFGGLIILYAFLGAVFVGLISQATYSQLAGLIDTTSGEVFSDGWGFLQKAGLITIAGFSGSFAPEIGEAQQAYAVGILLLTWLTTVWLLRAIVANKTPRLRDGLYNAGGPIVSTAIIFLLICVQFVPAALAILAINTGISTDLFSNGFVAMIVSLLAGLLILLSGYLATGSIIAMIVVTLPGMHPWHAVRTAGDLVVGRRVRILLRLVWLMVGSLLFWMLVVLPTVVLDSWLRSIVPIASSIPLVPAIIALVTATIVVWSASYIYLLYRKIVEDEAQPA